MSANGFRQPSESGPNSWPPTAFPLPIAHRRRRRVERVDDPVVALALPFYLDSGDASHVCVYCAAVFWYDERVLSASHVGSPVYSHCCKAGAVVLPSFRVPPPSLPQLFEESHFRHNIRAYNSMFSMTSFGARIDDSVNTGRGPYTFKISGQVSHWIGCLSPTAEEKPRFLQLYVYDTENEVENKLRAFSGGDAVELRPAVVAVLAQILSAHNAYVQTFRNAVRIASEHRLDQYSVRLYSNERDGRYDLPHAGVLGAIVVADDPNASGYDVIVQCKDGPPHRISKLHHSYMPLQYPLLFPYGEAGWSTCLKLRTPDGQIGRSMTVNAYYSFLLHNRSGLYSLLLRGGRLFQQFVVDVYLCVEDSRLEFARTHQNQLRSEYVAGIYDAISKGDSEGKHIGKRTFLPSSFVGGPRYMYKHYQDALAICRVYGNPQYFITFTCNVQWPEIVRFMESNGVNQAQDRPNIIAHVFQMKVSQFIKFLKEDKPFGSVSAYLYTIEFQKRGLPHCHTLLWVETVSKIRTPADVDKFISAELPDPVTEPLLYATVTNCMINGPCDLPNSASPCMRDGVCKKKFPKPFSLKTFFDKDGYVHYKRGDAAFHVLLNGVKVHNGYVVPYNKRLLSRFDAHINVEHCGWNMLIKYLFKYISKGVERVSFALHKEDVSAQTNSASTSEPVNEIQKFLDGRFVCPHEGCWRIFNFSIHERHPSVQVLSVHLENLQNVTFDDNAALQEMVENVNFGKTTLTRWLVNNRWDPDGRHLTYVEYPSLFRWNVCTKDWICRSRNTVPPVGRLVYVHPTAGELFFLRTLLCHQKGCRSFTELRTVGRVVYGSYRLACEALGLVGDDREWLTAFMEASIWASSSELRSLFCYLLLFCDVTNPILLWENAFPKMGDDILRTLNDSLSTPQLSISEDVLKQHVLFDLEKLLNAATPSKSLTNFQLPLPSSAMLLSLQNRLLPEETMYDTVRLQNEHSDMLSKLNSDQLCIYNRIRGDYELGRQTLLFVYGHGGTGKTFLWSTILAYFRSIGKVILAVAASGIALTFL